MGRKRDGPNRCPQLCGSLPPRGVLKRRVMSAKRMIFFEGTFFGFLKPSQDFFLCYVQLSHGVLISMSKIRPFQFEGLASVLFNDVV